MPLVAVDLVIEHDGGVVLDKRENEFVKCEWFVPGGTVCKNESRTDAVHRVAEEEFGQEIVIDDCSGPTNTSPRRLRPEVDSKHYLATGFRCHFGRDDPEVGGDKQHSAFQVVRSLFHQFYTINAISTIVSPTTPG